MNAAQPIYCFYCVFWTSITSRLYISLGNIKLWIARTDLVRCNHRLGVLSGDAMHVYRSTGSVVAMAAHATSWVASDSNI